MSINNINPGCAITSAPMTKKTDKYSIMGPKDRANKKEVKKKYQEQILFQSHNTCDHLNAQVKKCSSLYKEVNNSKSNDSLAKLLIEKEVCRQFINDKRSAFKGILGKIVLLVDRLYGFLGWRTTQLEIDEAEDLLQYIENNLSREVHSSGEEALIQEEDAGKASVDSTPTTIHSKSELEAAIKGLPGIKPNSIKDFEFPENTHAKLYQSEIIKLDQVEFEWKDEANTAIGNLFLMKDDKNQWFAFFDHPSKAKGKPGRYKQAFEGWNLSSKNQPVAILVNNSHEKKCIQEIKDEFAVYDRKAIKDVDNVVKMQAFFVVKSPGNYKHCLLIEPLFSKGGLDQFIGKEDYGITEILQIGQGIVNGVYQLHQNDLIHRDLKPGNILIDKENKASIADLSSLRQENARTVLNGTPMYLAPEQVKFELEEAQGALITVTKEVDIWGLGHIFFELLYRQSLFTKSLFQRTYQVNLHQKFDKNSLFELIGNYSQKELNAELNRLNKNLLKNVHCQEDADFILEMSEFIKELLQIDPKRRPTMQEVQKKWNKIYSKHKISEEIDDLT